MQVTQVSYERLFSQDMPSYENERLGVVITVDPDENVADVLTEARKIVEAQHRLFNEQRDRERKQGQLMYRLNVDISVAIKKAIIDASRAGACGEEGMEDSHRYWQEITDLSEYERINDYLEQNGGTWGLWQVEWRRQIAERDDDYEDDNYDD